LFNSDFRLTNGLPQILEIKGYSNETVRGPLALSSYTYEEEIKSSKLKETRKKMKIANQNEVTNDKEAEENIHKEDLTKLQMQFAELQKGKDAEIEENKRINSERDIEIQKIMQDNKMSEENTRKEFEEVRAEIGKLGEEIRVQKQTLNEKDAEISKIIFSSQENTKAVEKISNQWKAEIEAIKKAIVEEGNPKFIDYDHLLLDMLRKLELLQQGY